MLRLKLLNQQPPSRRCRFVLSMPGAKYVAVTGDFYDWNPLGKPMRQGPDRLWRVAILLAPGIYEYRFMADGRWLDDPACNERVSNPFGSMNCVLRVESRESKARNSPMTTSELETYRQALQTLAAPLARNLARDQREFLRLEDPSVAGGPMPSTEDETNEGLREVEIGLIANEAGLLEEISAALKRIDEGTFGACVTCGKKITKPRLEALPHARECINCAKVSQPVGR